MSHQEESKFDLKLYLDTKFQENRESHAALQERVDKTNGRVRSLEKWRYAIGGALTIISIMLTLMPIILKATK